MEKHRAHVGLEVHTGEIERERADSLRRCGTDARQRRQSPRFVRKLPAVLADDLLGRRLEREGAPVVAHALPRLEHVGHRRGGKRLHRRKPVEPLRPAALDPRYLRLLEHDLRKPDLIRVARVAPRKIAIQTNAFRPHARTEGVKSRL